VTLASFVRVSITALHLAVPWGLRRRATFDCRVSPPANVDDSGASTNTTRTSNPSQLYDIATVVLATVALAVRSSAVGRPSDLRSRSPVLNGRRMPSIGIGMVSGALLPRVIDHAVHARGHSTSRTPIGCDSLGNLHALRTIGRTVIIAVAEELIWRGPSLGPTTRSTQSTRLVQATGAVLRVAGFAALHGARRRRDVPYHVVTGALFESLRRSLGFDAAVAGHVAHNIEIDRRRRPELHAESGSQAPLAASEPW